jgi:hypothetical protein
MGGIFEVSHSVAVIYVHTQFINIGLGIQKLLGGYTDTQIEWRMHKLTLGNYANKKNVLFLNVSLCNSSS